MSATNWAICPICLKAAEKEHEQRWVKLEKKYGEIDENEYRRAFERLKEQEVKPENYRTLREDYEMGILVEENKFYAEYRGKCDECGNEFNFNRYKNNPLS